MKILDWTKEINNQELKDVVKSINRGELVIFPTETVYGIGALATNELSVDAIFKAKGRANDNPLIVHLANKEEITKYAIISNEIEQKLIDAFMPGPFTIILKKKNIIPNNVSANLDTVGIRIPASIVINRILTEGMFPIAAPSANTSGKPSGTNIKDIESEFKDKNISYIIDGGHTDIGLESTVVKVIDNIPVILRPGYITKEDILNTIGVVKVSDSIFKKVDGPVLSPGMKYRHYAPSSNCQLVYIENDSELITYIKSHTTKNTVIIGSSKLSSIKCKAFLYYGDTLKEISHNIFELLRKADTYKPDKIIIEGVKKEGLGLAIMNRLIRACSYNYYER